ncbi:hypothetical protein VB712_14075 [Spirulina sp. CCNP1310]|uniref:type II toxin-antitoxin system RelN family antitoxin n=1 Tax=Spirulina sp. CCNP1310 TaxID=3110249 RepID=UPI002B214012|nr:hypothetical protein [Spirulina sp. CCNP1310]MEA5420355.1 hypothetical protein [Spirulina sp. CCNP1310]
MEALEIAAIVDSQGNLQPEYPLNLATHRRVRVIILLEDDPDDEPKAAVLENLRQAWQETKMGETLPLSALWEEESEYD